MVENTSSPKPGERVLLTSGKIEKLGAILQERDVPAQPVLTELAARGIRMVHHTSAPEAAATRAAAGRKK
jgi:hypothetical protein